MKKILKRWGTILLGFCFIKAFDITDALFVEEKYQFAFKVICLLGALVAFGVSIVTDEKLNIKSVKEDRWILYSSYISIVVMFVAILIVLVAGAKYFI